MSRALAIIIGWVALAGAASAEGDRGQYSRLQARLTEQLNAAITADVEREVGGAAVEIPLPEKREDKLAASGLHKTS